MTTLHPVTKLMAHLPMAALNHPPQKALAICFGMGTTFRSLVSWGISTTAVELVPDVPRMFWYYHPDAAKVVRSPFARIVIDDGRRFLERSKEQYDVITVDPPPPIEAAGSSMLYSKEFYSVIGKRLRQDGIMQQWLPGGDAVVRSAVARALTESFPYVRVFETFPKVGYSFLASRQPISTKTGAELLQRMPESAVRDLMEMPFKSSAQLELDTVMQNEKSVAELEASDPGTGAMRDDHPVNEYVLLRQWGTEYQSSPLMAWYQHFKSR